MLKPMNGTADSRVTINMKDLALQYQPKYALNGNIYGQVNLDDPDKLLYQEPADFKAPIYPATYSNGKRAEIAQLVVLSIVCLHFALSTWVGRRLHGCLPAISFRSGKHISVYYTTNPIIILTLVRTHWLSSCISSGLLA